MTWSFTDGQLPHWWWANDYNWWVQPEFKIFGAKLPQIYQNESNIMVQQSHDTGNWCSNEYLHLKTSPIWEMRPTKDLSRGLWSVVNISGLCQLNVPLNLLSINAFHLRINNKLIKKLYDTHFKCCLSLRPVFKRSWRLKLNNLMTSCSVQFWKKNSIIWEQVFRLKEICQVKDIRCVIRLLFWFQISLTSSLVPALIWLFLVIIKTHWTFTL